MANMEHAKIVTARLWIDFVFMIYLHWLVLAADLMLGRLSHVNSILMPQHEFCVIFELTFHHRPVCCMIILTESDFHLSPQKHKGAVFCMSHELRITHPSG